MISILAFGIFAASGLRAQTFTSPVDPACFRADPTVTFSPTEQITAGMDTADYTVTVFNNDSPNCGESTFTLSATTSALELMPALQHSALRLGPGQSATSVLLVTPRQYMMMGNYTVSVTAKNMNSTKNVGSGLATLVYGPLPCSIDPPSIGLDPASQSAFAGGVAIFVISITNRDSEGCESRAFRFHTDLPDGFMSKAEPQYVALKPGSSTTVILEISVSDKITRGNYPFLVKTVETHDILQGIVPGTLTVKDNR